MKRLLALATTAIVPGALFGVPDGTSHHRSLLTGMPLWHPDISDSTAADR